MADVPHDIDPEVPTSYREWPLDPEVWRNALRYRAVEWGYVGNPYNPGTLDTIAEMKELLLNGHVLTYSTHAYDWQFDTILDDPATSEVDAFTGQEVATWQNGNSMSHRMTIVGYDDDIWVDLNDNTTVDAGEKGAFKVANSWSAEWGNAGYMWVAYDSLFSETQVVGGPGDDSRSQMFLQVAWVTARADYQPTALAEFTVMHPERFHMAITLGASNPALSEPTELFVPEALYSKAGLWAFDGTTTPVVGTFVFDASDLRVDLTSQKYYLGMENSTWASAAGEILGFKLIDVQNGGLVINSRIDPIEVPPGEAGHAVITHDFSPLLVGDVDQNGSITQADADLAEAFFNQSTALTSTQLVAADANTDGWVSVHDVRLIGAAANGQIATLPDQLPMGDVNDSGGVNIVDALLIANYYVGNLQLDLAQQIRGDVNGTQATDIVDALLVADYYVGNITEFPFEKR